MNEADGPLLEERVLVLAPTPKDAARSRALLTEAGLACALCDDLAGLCREVAAGAGEGPRRPHGALGVCRSPEGGGVSTTQDSSR